MKKQGAIILGIGGDNSNSAVGTFFEGCIAAGFSTEETDRKLQLNIRKVGYRRASSLLDENPEKAGVLGLEVDMEEEEDDFYEVLIT